MPSPHFGNAPFTIGCLTPVRTEEELLKFRDLGGSADEAGASKDMRELTSSRGGDIFLVKNGVGVVLTWVRVVAGGGKGLDITHGFSERERADTLKRFAQERHSTNRLLALSWEDHQGKLHLDRVRVEARIRQVVGLPLPKSGGGRVGGEVRGRMVK